MNYGWQLNVKNTKQMPSSEVKLTVCSECYKVKFPFGVIYDGGEVLCPHVFALKVAKSNTLSEKVKTE